MTSVSLVEAGVAALREEAAALAVLADKLPDDGAFAAVLELIMACKGRVIVSGVGKSGHIGGKIAASLASTGTPAFFVHPTEALHGDLGMITKDDVVIALSHSGESKELGPVITYVTRFGIPLIAVTSKPDSTLGKAATHVLNTHVQKEACPLNLAPTTSTTASLALCDALTVALMHARGFAKEDFAVYHPGGKLGARLLRIEEVMVADNLPLLPVNAPAQEILLGLTNRNLGCVGFVDEQGLLAGIFTDGDLKRRMTAEFLTKTAADVMTKAPKTIAAGGLAAAAVAQMDAQKVSALWVVEKGRPVGLIRLADCVHRGIV
jgi:arabinose-5-phosphate isomerase